MIFFSKLNKAIDEGLVIIVFTHIRNFLMCMTIIIAGLFAVESQYKIIGILPDESYGIIVILVGVILTLLNLYDGMYRLSKRKLPAIINYLLIGFYIIFTLRVFQIILHFRSIG